MDVINLSLGEPEIDAVARHRRRGPRQRSQRRRRPGRRGGKRRIDGGDMLAGMGGVGSPGTAPQAIAVAASTIGDRRSRRHDRRVLVDGPTPTLAPDEAGRDRAGRRRALVLPENQWSNTPAAGRAWRARMSPAAPRYSRSGIRPGPSSRSSPRSSRPAIRCTRTAPTPRSRRCARAAVASICLAPTTPLVFTDPTNLAFGLVKRGTTTTEELGAHRRGRRPGAMDADDRAADDGHRRSAHVLHTDRSCRQPTSASCSRFPRVRAKATRLVSSS